MIAPPAALAPAGPARATNAFADPLPREAFAELADDDGARSASPRHYRRAALRRPAPTWGGTTRTWVRGPVTGGGALAGELVSAKAIPHSP
jgi:hypothetical protein